MRTDRYYFDTVSTKNRRVFRKNSARVIDVEQEAARIGTVIAEAKRLVSVLDQSIGAEEDRTGIRDVSHFAYSISAATMRARRDNLKLTIAALDQRLRKLNAAPPAIVIAAA